MADWFEENAPPVEEPPPQEQDWFAQNAPPQEAPPTPSRIQSAYIPPDVEKEVTQRFDEAHPIMGAAAQALGETVSGFVPTSVEQVGQLATPVVGAVEDIGKAGASLRDVLFGGQGMTQAAETNYPESLVLREAEKTPPFSKERFAAGFGTVANVGMAAAIGRGLNLREMLFGPQKLESAPITEAEVVGTPRTFSPAEVPYNFETSLQTQPERRFQMVDEPRPEIAPVQPLEQQVAELPSQRVIQTPEGDVPIPERGTVRTGIQSETQRIGEPTNASEQSNAQVQAGTTAQRVETGTESAIPRPSDSNNVVGETQGTAARGQVPARQGTEAQPEIKRTDIPEDASVLIRGRKVNGGEGIVEMNARQAEGRLTKERSSYQTLLDCLGR